MRLPGPRIAGSSDRWMMRGGSGMGYCNATGPLSEDTCQPLEVWTSPIALTEACWSLQIIV